jgi:hypothetical protein
MECAHRSQKVYRQLVFNRMTSGRDFMQLCAIIESAPRASGLPVDGAALDGVAAAVGAVRAGADRRPSAPALVWALPEQTGSRTGVGTIPVCFPDGWYPVGVGAPCL